MRFASVAFTAVAACPTFAAAQDTDVQMMYSIEHGAAPTDPDAVRFVAKFAACAARDVRSYARDVLRRTPGSYRSSKDLYLLATVSNSCVPFQDRLKYSPRYLRGPVAEYFLKVDFALPDWKTRARPASLYTLGDDAEIGKLSPAQKTEMMLVEIGACIWTRNAPAVATLFGTEPASSAETTAFGALSGTMSECLPAGAPLKMSKFQMRGYLAEGAYRAASAAASQQD